MTASMPTAVMQRRAPIRRKLREHVSDTILGAAEEVAIENGLGGLTIAAVADRAGVAVGTLYNYFPDRDAIITELFKDRRAAIAPLIAAAFTDTKHLPFEHRLREFVRRLMVAFQSYEPFLRIANLADRDGGKANRNTALAAQTVAALEKIMREGARSKFFPSARAPIYARLMHGALRSMFQWRLSEKHPFTADGDLVVDTFLRGIIHAQSGHHSSARA